MPETKIERPLLVWHPPGGGAPTEHEVWPERPMTIGRDATNSVVIDSPFVSKTHAIIRYSGGEYTVEDLKSANGTRVNGAPILVSVLSLGDVLEVGDQRFEFIDGQQAGPKAKGGLGKNAKLALVAIGTLGVMGMFMAMIVSSGPKPAASQPAERPAAAKAMAAAQPVAPPAVDTHAAVVTEALDHAQQAGIKPIDALFDDANTMLASGRLREAAELFGAVLERDPKNESAERRFKEARTAWAQAIADHAAEAERAADELRLNDAMLEWGKVLLLTESSDPRHQAAERGITAARTRLSR